MSSNLHKRKSGFMEDLYIGVVKIDQKITFRLKFQFHALFFFRFVEMNVKSSNIDYAKKN